MPRLFTCVLLIAFVCPCLRADDNEENTFLDPKDAGTDYLLQGEYSGMLAEDGDSRKFGLQVIALGDHRFDATCYPGGLPGDGWRGKKKFAASGETVDGVTKIVAEGIGHAIIARGSAQIFSEKDHEVGTMKKVERRSPTLGAKPPAGAVILFDGSTAEHFERGEITMGNLLAANCESKEKLGDHSMHLEFRTPFKPHARGQARGNSGVYLQGRYECQVLDSFGLEGKNNECGGIYSIAEPAVNACFPPLTWQTYDIDFTAARYEDGKKVVNARTTIKHNGITIHDDLELPHGTPGKLPEEEGPGLLYLQGHGNPVVYRNIWFVRK
ncbi:MAG: DUF1080 domain-containing protein [Fuerstiella sp.]|nr:DUF1080 domain-containing protein [Fuerstiella sp.]MCP4782913.1 DUF1080 domain-containing protein [Fuerstiella sp.]MCP4853695.1 DUF1080 domain-containing protein [Fuerstiella sp.]